MGQPERSNQPDGYPHRQNAASDRYDAGGGTGYPGFHTYATSEFGDANADDGWPDNWPEPVGDDDYAALDNPGTRRDYLGAVLWAAGWLSVPLLILLSRALLLSAAPDPSCSGPGLGNCASPRAAALADLLGASPMWILALLASVSLALVLRWASDAWRAMTIGLCAAIVAGGATTLLHSIGG